MGFIHQFMTRGPTLYGYEHYELEAMAHPLFEHLICGVRWQVSRKLSPLFSLTRESLQILNLAVNTLFEAHSGVNLSHCSLRHTPTAASAQNLIQTFCTSTATVCTMGQAHEASGIDRICFIQLQLKTGLWMTGDWHWTNGAKYGWHSARNWKFKLIFAPRASQAIEADSKSDNFRGTWSC